MDADAEELGERDGLALPEVELEGLSEDEGDRDVLELAELDGEILADTLVLGESDALGEVDELGESEELAEPDGDVEALGEREDEGETEGLGEVEALGEADAEGEITEPATRTVTEEPAEIGFQRQMKRIRPDVIAAVPTLIIMSRLIARTGKLVTVLAIKVACGVAPVQISSVFNWVAVVEAIKAAVESLPPPAWSSRCTPTLIVALEPARSFSTIA